VTFREKMSVFNSDPTDRLVLESHLGVSMEIKITYRL
jgi:hypothetical protein